MEFNVQLTRQQLNDFHRNLRAGRVNGTTGIVWLNSQAGTLSVSQHILQTYGSNGDKSNTCCCPCYISQTRPDEGLWEI